MQRADLEHVLRASGAITEEEVMVVIGSQSLLGSYPDLPEALTRSMELDLYPEACPAKADLIDGTIGELSPFHETFGYHAHGVGPETATLAPGWRDRVVRVENANTRGVVGLCLSPSDLVVSKLAAGRPKDLAFVQAMWVHGLFDLGQARALIELLPAELGQRCFNQLERCVKESGRD